MKRAALLNDTTREAGHIGCLKTISSIISACAEAGIIITYRDSVINGDINESEFIALISSCDIVIVNGEGSLHHDAAKLLYRKCEIAKASGKPVFLINSVWQENEQNKIFLPIFNLAFVRESFSLKEIQKDGFSSAKVVPDMVFYLPHEHRHRRIREGGMVIDSVMLDISQKLAKYALSSKKPLYFMGSWHARNFFKRYPLTYLKLGMHRNIKQSIVHAEELIASKDHVVTGRYHGACFSVRTGTPFIAVTSNTHKIEGLISDIGLDPTLYCIHQNKFDEAKIRNSIESMLNLHDSREFIDKCSQYIIDAKEKILDMFRTIRDY